MISVLLGGGGGGETGDGGRGKVRLALDSCWEGCCRDRCVLRPAMFVQSLRVLVRFWVMQVAIRENEKKCFTNRI